MSHREQDAHVRFIMGVHAESPGLTERSIGAARTSTGRSSYEAFCDFVAPGAGMTVVDLACGNGPLGEVVLQRIGPGGQLIEVDLSEAELALATERFRGLANVRLLHESAGQLSLPDASADLVLCHMAFMLFDPLTAAVDEIARVLKPGGAFAAVVPSLRAPSPLFRACAGVLQATLAAERCEQSALSGHTAKMASGDDLRSIFDAGHWAAEAIAIRDIDVFISAAPDVLAAQVAPAFYNHRLLSAPARQRVEDAWRQLFREQCDSSGRTRFDFPLSAFLVRKR